MTVITYDKLHEASVERNAMTGDFTCKLCGCVWGSNAQSEFHRPECLLAESGYARDIERLRARVEDIDTRLRLMEERCKDRVISAPVLPEHY